MNCSAWVFAYKWISPQHWKKGSKSKSIKSCYICLCRYMSLTLNEFLFRLSRCLFSWNAQAYSKSDLILFSSPPYTTLDNIFFFWNPLKNYPLIEYSASPPQFYHIFLLPIPFLWTDPNNFGLKKTEKQHHKISSFSH